MRSGWCHVLGQHMQALVCIHFRTAHAVRSHTAAGTFTDHKSSLHYCMMTRVKVVKGQGTAGIVCRGVARSTASRASAPATRSVGTADMEVAFQAQLAQSQADLLSRAHS